MSFFYATKDFELAGKSLIVPIVSTANVSQLAVDLLIASLSLKQIGIFDPKDIVPVVGGREDGLEGITTPLELYGRDQVNVVVIQQRSPVMKSRKQEFTECLLDFIQSSSFAACVFLSGVEMTNRTDAQMLTPTYYIHPQNTPPLTPSPLSALTQLPIPEYTSPVLQHPQAISNESSIPFIPGGGLTRRFLSSLPSAWAIPTVSLLQFAVEGDNRADANLLAAVVAKILAVDSLIQEWKQPTSWKQGLFGTMHDQSLYG
jgi:proteasome assembly chaperone 2